MGLMSSIHDPARGWTKGMPNFALADTPWRRDPTRCHHPLKPFIGTLFVDSAYRHRIVQLFRCVDCGRVFEIERDVRSAGLSGAVDIDDPRVIRTLRYNKSVDERYFKEWNDGRCDFPGRGMEVA